jgi:hypothetical protein
MEFHVFGILVSAAVMICPAAGKAFEDSYSTPALGLSEEEMYSSVDQLELTSAAVVDTSMEASSTEKSTMMDNQGDLPSATTSAGRLQAFSAYLSKKVSESQHQDNRPGDSNVACCARSIFTLHSSMDDPSAVHQTAVNVSDDGQATTHEDMCCDEQIVELLQNVSTVYATCSRCHYLTFFYCINQSSPTNAIKKKKTIVSKMPTSVMQKSVQLFGMCIIHMAM